MPALSLKTRTRSNIMENQNTAEEIFHNDNSSQSQLRISGESNNNINSDLEGMLGTRQNYKDYMLDSDEISVIGYTDDNSLQNDIAASKAHEEIMITSESDRLNLAGVNSHLTTINCDLADTNEIEEPCSEFEKNENGLQNNNELDLSKEELPSNIGVQDRAQSLWDVDDNEPIHMTLEDVRLSLYVGDWDVLVTDSSESNVPNEKVESELKQNDEISKSSREKVTIERDVSGAAESSHDSGSHIRLPRLLRHHRPHSSSERSFNSRSIKHTLCNWLGLGRCGGVDIDSASSSDWPDTLTHLASHKPAKDFDTCLPDDSRENSATYVNRALPPLPNELSDKGDNKSSAGDRDEEHWQPRRTSVMVSERILPDFAESICKVKDCGWYWGPISGEMAEKILASEPDGSFVLRDSSDERYIFSLTFKLNGFVRHVRIEHDHGNFSFGSFTKFKSHTIVEFIENAVRHSRSGRYLFFLHRRPALGPMRVQLLYPVSRFKGVQSLQHMCRFVILKAVRKDLIAELPLPAKLKNYLDTQQYYTEQMQDIPLAATSSVNADEVESTESVL